MLWFVGIGISGYDSISSKGLSVIRDADIVYLEQFTSPIEKQEVSRIEEHIGKRFKIAKRWMIEDGKEILKTAKTGNVVLLSYGDPYIATTHIELRTRAMQQGILTDTVHGSSSITSMIGQCGLHHYKMGRIATIMDEARSATTPYYVTYGNLIEGNHTMLLLEYNQDRDYFLDPKEALAHLLDAERGQGRKVICHDTFAIVASRIGSKNQAIVSGTISKLNKVDLGDPPHTIIIPGRMHFTEIDALKVLSRCMDEPKSNSDTTKKISVQMMQRYVPMIREALEEIAPHCKDSKLVLILENAELYIKDAELFLQEGRDEVAVLSIGYADGLVDALRMASGMDPKMEQIRPS